MKKIYSYLLILTLLFTMSGGVSYGYSAKDIIVTPDSKTASVDGSEVTLEVAAKIVNGRTMVPIRFVAENLGFEVAWTAATKTAVIGDNGEITLIIGAPTATVNGKTVTLDAPAMIENGRALVPLRFISESLGAEVDWDSEAKVATISYSTQLLDATALYGTSSKEEAAVLAALDPKFAYDFAAKLASFGDSERGFHLIGSTAGKKASQYVYDTFQSVGLTPEFSKVNATGWEYYDSTIAVKDHADLDYFITSAPYTPATPKEGITAEVVYVGTATAAEMDAVDLTGKIALADFDWDYSLWMNNIEHAAAKRGAVGLIYYTTNPYGSDESGQAEFVADWSGKTATIPTWSMRQADGLNLKELVTSTPTTVTVVSDCKTIEDATGYNVLATIEGSKYPDEYIVINAHFDAYFHCLQDDSAPVGIMMAMAKAMVDTNYKPDRSIIFVATDGEECGGGETFYDWLVGSWDLVNKKVDSWGGQIVDAHTIELIADSESTNFGFRVSDPMYLFTKALANGMNASGSYSNDVLVENYMATSSDEWSFSYIGAPTTRTIREDASTQVYHSTMDNPDRFSYANYVEYINAQASLILRIDKQALAPYDLARDAELYLGSLNADALNGQGQNYDALEAASASYLTNAENLLTTNLAIAKQYSEASAAGKDLTAVNKLLADYNEAQRTSLETVLKGTQYVALDQPVNQVQYYQGIPAVFESAVAALESGKGDGLLDIFYGLDSDDMGQFSVWYSECLDYDTWSNSYAEALAADPKADYRWVSGRLLKYYDFYGILESVNGKIEAGNTDFSAEIATLNAMQKDAETHLTNGVSADISMWNLADRQLPIQQAEKIVEALDAL